MERIDELIHRKRQIMAIYRERLGALPGVGLNPEPEGTINGAWMPTVVFDEASKVTREKLQKAFAAENADARAFFWPLSSLPMFEPVTKNKLAYGIPGRAINLPSYHEMTDSDLHRVCGTVRSLIGGHR